MSISIPRFSSESTDDTRTAEKVATVPLSCAETLFTPGKFSALVGLFIFASFPQVLLGLETFVVRDFGFFAYPLAHYQRECFWRGELPLWNPYNFCGLPFLAQWNTMPLYPPALIYLILPLTWSLSFFCLLHLFWAGLGMYFLARKWTGNSMAAALAGLLFSFNGLSLNLLMWPSHIATLSWMPWVVLLVERAWRDGGRAIFVAALAGAMQMLAGGPETILFTWLILSVMWLAQMGQTIWRSRNAKASEFKTPAISAMLWSFPLMTLLVAALAAAQLLPFLDLTAHSQRELGYADSRWAMPVRGWANFFVPMVFGQTWTTGVFFQHFQAWTSSYYLGYAAMLLALLAIFKAREKRVWLLAIGAGLALMLGFGDKSPLFRALGHLVPHLSLMTNPVKFVTVVVFATPLLAAYGLAAWRQAPEAKFKTMDRLLLFISATFLLLIGGILGWAKWSPLPHDSFSDTFRNGLSRAGILAGTTILLLIWRKIQLPQLQRLLPLAFMAFCWLDVLTHEPQQNPSVPAWIYQPGLARQKLAMNPQPALGASRAMVTPQADLKLTQSLVSSLKDNFVVKRLGYFANCNLLDAVPKVNGFFSLCPRECDQLNTALYGAPWEVFPPLYDFLGISQITAPDKSFDWESRASFLPMVTAGQKPLFLNDTNALNGILSTNFNAAKLVILPREAKSAVSVTNRCEAKILAANIRTQQIDADVEAADTALVVLSQTYYHLWRATVDGKPARLLRANYAFQAVQVPSGRHHLQVKYVDRNFFTGAVTSGLALAGCCAGLVRRSKPRAIEKV